MRAVLYGLGFAKVKVFEMGSGQHEISSGTEPLAIARRGTFGVTVPRAFNCAGLLITGNAGALVTGNAGALARKCCQARSTRKID
jgi:hypothetical protein